MSSEQSQLFESGGSRPSGLYAQIIFRKNLERSFTYSVPESLAESVAVGKRVQVPFGKGNQKTVGYCVELNRTKPERAVKAVTAVIDDEPLLTPALLQLTRWMADYYLCGWGQVLNAVVPAGAKSQAGTQVQRLIEAVPIDQLPLPPSRLTAKQSKALTILRDEGRTLTPADLAAKAGVGTASFKLSSTRASRSSPGNASNS